MVRLLLNRSAEVEHMNLTQPYVEFITLLDVEEHDLHALALLQECVDLVYSNHEDFPMYVVEQLSEIDVMVLLDMVEVYHLMSRVNWVVVCKWLNPFE